ncbi:MAG: hypothetical protein AAF267_23625 [Deinococcota bacterium]
MSHKLIQYLRREGLRHIAVVIIAGLVACTPLPNVPPPDAPIIFEASYSELFDATLEAMTLAYVDRPGRIRYDFAVSQAAPDTGLISAFRDDARVRYRRSSRNISIDYDDDIVEVDVFVPVQELERSIVTAVVRPLNDAQSSLVYSTTSDTGSTVIANAYMGEVLARLEARFTRLN